MSFFEDLDDALQQLFSPLLALCYPAFKPLVVARATNIKCIAHHVDAVMLSLFMDDGILYCRVFAKYAAAFFKNSFSSLSRLFSL